MGRSESLDAWNEGLQIKKCLFCLKLFEADPVRNSRMGKTGAINKQCQKGKISNGADTKYGIMVKVIRARCTKRAC